MDFDLLYSLPSVLSTCRWTVPYLASNVGGDCGAVVIFQKNLKAPRSSEHPPVKNVKLSHITACNDSGPWSHRKIIPVLARREVGNKCCLYKHFVVAAKK